MISFDVPSIPYSYHNHVPYWFLKGGREHVLQERRDAVLLLLFVGIVIGELAEEDAHLSWHQLLVHLLSLKAAPGAWSVGYPPPRLLLLLWNRKFDIEERLISYPGLGRGRLKEGFASFKKTFSYPNNRAASKHFQWVLLCNAFFFFWFPMSENWSTSSNFR